MQVSGQHLHDLRLLPLRSRLEVVYLGASSKTFSRRFLSKSGRTSPMNGWMSSTRDSGAVHARTESGCRAYLF